MKRILLALAVLGLCPALSAQVPKLTVEEILGKHLDAIGRKEALAKLKGIITNTATASPSIPRWFSEEKA